MIYVCAYGLLLGAFCVALWAAASCLGNVAGWWHLRPWGHAHWWISGFLLVAGACLLHALFWQDYSLDYVAAYTDANLAPFYRLTAFWAGQPGSLLFWAMCAACTGSIFAIFLKNAALRGMALSWFWLFYYSLVAFLCFLLVCFSNPFLLTVPAPADGAGLNPLLQNPGMIFHPPLLLLSYAVFTVPGCLALAAALAPGLQRPWYALARPYLLCAWSLLTAGIILGAWWAYMELGWGGYWAWDPVENASLLPWLLSTALLHTIMVQRRRGELRRLNLALMGLTLASTFFATWIVRGGAVQSIHAFSAGDIGSPLLCFAGALGCVSLCAGGLAARGPALGPLAATGAALLTCWLCVALALVIALATVWPLISSALLGFSVSLEPAFYNAVCLPLAVALLWLLGACSWLKMNNASLPQRRALAGASLLSAASCAVLCWYMGYRDPLALAGATGAAAGGAAACVLLALHRNIRTGAHLGMAILALGVAFSGPYRQELTLSLSLGCQNRLGEYEISLRDLSEGKMTGYDYLRAELAVSQGGRLLGTLAPERRLYGKLGNAQFAEAAVLPGPGKEIYAALLGIGSDGRASVLVAIEPLVDWIWVGGALLALFPLLSCILPRRRMTGD